MNTILTIANKAKQDIMKHESEKSSKEFKLQRELASIQTTEEDQSHDGD